MPPRLRPSELLLSTLRIRLINGELLNQKESSNLFNKMPKITQITSLNKMLPPPRLTSIKRLTELPLLLKLKPPMSGEELSQLEFSMEPLQSTPKITQNTSVNIMLLPPKLTLIKKHKGLLMLMQLKLPTSGEVSSQSESSTEPLHRTTKTTQNIIVSKTPRPPKLTLKPRLSDNSKLLDKLLQMSGEELSQLESSMELFPKKTSQITSLSKTLPALVNPPIKKQIEMLPLLENKHPMSGEVLSHLDSHDYNK